MSDGSETFRYVVLRHEQIPQPHYDLLFENKLRTQLLSARVSQWPIAADTPIERTPPHRLMYLDYQGPIAGGRGSVRRVAQGTCTTNVDRVGSLLLRLDDGQEISIPRDVTD
jgi:hypothetical protein